MNKLDMTADVNSEKYDDVTLKSHVHHHGSMHHDFDASDDSRNEMQNHRHNILDGTRDSNNMHNMHNMQMHSNTFSLITESDFLIEGINIACVRGIILAMLFSIVITILHDTIKVVLRQWEIREEENKKIKTAKKSKENLFLFVKAVFHLMSVSLAYLTMLCVMTMNVWLFIAVVLGSGIAHLLIRPILVSKLCINSANITNEVAVENADLLREHENEDQQLKSCCQTDSLETTTLMINNTTNI